MFVAEAIADNICIVQTTNGGLPYHNNYTPVKRSGDIIHGVFLREPGTTLP